MMNMEMDIYSIVSTITTLVFGGGWFINYREKKRRENGEAIQAEAEGWLKQQEAYHNTIDELTNHCEFIKQDRNLLRDENTQLRKENAALREKVNEMEMQILDLKKELSRLGRRVEAMSRENRNTKKEKE